MWVLVIITVINVGFFLTIKEKDIKAMKIMEDMKEMM